MKRWAMPLATIGLLGVAAFILYFSLQAMAPEPTTTRSRGIVRIFPLPGAVAVRQVEIGAELEFGWEGRLEIDGRNIPDDQIDTIPGINRLSFTPGPGKEIEALDKTIRHCVDLFYWQAATGPDSAGPPRSWCFTAS